ncbi:MAG TPA: hypothetical protein VHU42_16540, partial [Rhodopila sp.]|nr:hypothetical protein [Rhodopila sp.]
MFADQTRQNRTARDRTLAQTASRAVGPGTAQLTRLAVDLNGAAPVRQLRDMTTMLDQRVATAGPLQRLMSSADTERSSAGLPTRHGTGLRRQLKSGIESLSGISMDGVNVHYNSSRPAQLNALAYARGNDIH